MKEGLKQKLIELIKSRNGGMVSVNEIEFICKRDRYKLSNAERRLRASESPEIERLMKNGAIIGYRYIGASYNGNTAASNTVNRGSAPLAPAKKTKTFCCLKDWHNQGHDPKCRYSRQESKVENKQISMF